jgi:biopolymer transport protein ExbB/TolQ
LSERLRAEQYLGILGTLGSMSPFIGLFGTVVGIIQAFHQLALGQAAAGASLVAAGIAEALVATAAGLMVAVPCIMAYNFLAGKVKKIAADMELAKKDYLHYNATKPGELSK